MECVNIRAYCQNCGRPSHCDVDYYEDLNNSGNDDTVKVCNICRCENCNKEVQHDI